MAKTVDSCLQIHTSLVYESVQLVFIILDKLGMMLRFKYAENVSVVPQVLEPCMCLLCVF